MHSNAVKSVVRIYPFRLSAYRYKKVLHIIDSASHFDILYGKAYEITCQRTFYSYPRVVAEYAALGILFDDVIDEFHP